MKRQLRIVLLDPRSSQTKAPAAWFKPVYTHAIGLTGSAEALRYRFIGAEAPRCRLIVVHGKRHTPWPCP